MRPRAVIVASGFALRADDSANGINQLPDHQFAQLDAHNWLPPTPAGQESVRPIPTAAAGATHGDMHDVPIR